MSSSLNKANRNPSELLIFNPIHENSQYPSHQFGHMSQQSKPYSCIRTRS